MNPADTTILPIITPKVAKRVGVREARNHLGDLLGQVHDDHETVIVERAGKPMGVLIPIALYEQLLAFYQQTTETLRTTAFKPAEKTPTNSLRGAFPELASITNDDLAWAKQQWNQSLELLGE